MGFEAVSLDGSLVIAVTLQKKQLLDVPPRTNDAEAEGSGGGLSILGGIVPNIDAQVDACALCLSLPPCVCICACFFAMSPIESLLRLAYQHKDDTVYFVAGLKITCSILFKAVIAGTVVVVHGSLQLVSTTVGSLFLILFFSRLVRSSDLE